MERVCVMSACLTATEAECCPSQCSMRAISTLLQADAQGALRCCSSCAVLYLLPCVDVIQQNFEYEVRHVLCSIRCLAAGCRVCAS